MVSLTERQVSSDIETEEGQDSKKLWGVYYVLNDHLTVFDPGELSSTILSGFYHIPASSIEWTDKPILSETFISWPYRVDGKSFLLLIDLNNQLE